MTKAPKGHIWVQTLVSTEIAAELDEIAWRNRMHGKTEFFHWR